MKGMYVMTLAVLIALAFPFGAALSPASAQGELVAAAPPSVLAEEDSDGILFEFHGGGITREPATETMVQVSMAHLCEANDELVLEKVEIYGESEIPVKTFDVNGALESVADSYDRLKSLLEKLQSTPMKKSERKPLP